MGFFSNLKKSLGIGKQEQPEKEVRKEEQGVQKVNFYLSDGTVRRSYTEQEYKTMDLADLSRFIDKYQIGLLDNNLAIKYFLIKKLGADNAKKFEDPNVLTSIATNVYEVGTKNNPFLTFIEKYAISDTPNLTEGVCVLVNNLLANGTYEDEEDIENADYLFSSSTYDEEDEEDVIEKIKSHLYL